MTRVSDAEILAALATAQNCAQGRARVPAVVEAGPVAAPARVGRTRADVLRAELAAMRDAEPVNGVTRLPWPDSWFDSRDPGEARACRRLWCDVLRAGIADAVGAWADYVARGLEAGGTFEAAAEAGFRVEMGWIGTAEFATVCRLAGLEPDAVASRLRRGARDRAAFDGIVGRFRAVQEARGRRKRSRTGEGDDGA